MKRYTMLLIKCKRKGCPRIIDVRKNHHLFNEAVSFDEYKRNEGFCKDSCRIADGYEKMESKKKIIVDKNKSKAKLMDGAFAIFSSLMELIRKDSMTEGLLYRINREIKKYGQ